MAQPSDNFTPVPRENANVKIRLGSLLFDMLLNKTISSASQPPESELPKHNHYAYELQYIAEGRGSLFVGEQEKRIGPGSLHLIGPLVFHTIRPDQSDAITRCVLQFTLQVLPASDPWFPQEESELIRSALASLSYCLLADDDRKLAIVRLMEQLEEETRKPAAAAYAHIHGLFTQLIVLMCRTLGREPGTVSLPHRVKDDLRVPLIERFFSNYQANLTLDMLAAQLHLSSKQTNRMLLRCYNKPFKKKLLETRIEAGKFLLRTSDRPIERIAEHVGYTASYFCRVFAEATGVTPSQYRTMHRSRQRD